jgi:hypothetical protein
MAGSSPSEAKTAAWSYLALPNNRPSEPCSIERRTMITVTAGLSRYHLFTYRQSDHHPIRPNHEPTGTEDITLSRGGAVLIHVILGLLLLPSSAVLQAIYRVKAGSWAMIMQGRVL